MNAYKTLKISGQDTYIVNKSRFLCYASPAATEEEALSFLNTIRQKHRDATHNCYAYIIGQNSGIMRFSDDGEPGGTAGMPIMEVMKNRHVVNCVCVITRYFGGILLGAGGLVRAYSHSASLALNAAQVVTMEKSQRYLCDVPYPLWDKVDYFLKSQPILRKKAEFTASVFCTLLVREKDAEAFLKSLESLTNARVETMMEDECYYPWPENEDEGGTESEPV